MNNMSHTAYTNPLNGDRGFRISIPLPKYLADGSATVVVISNGIKGNKLYADICDCSSTVEVINRACEELEGEALKYLSENRFCEPLSEWADDVIETAEVLWQQFKMNHFRETELRTKDDEFFCVVAPCTLKAVGCEMAKADIEYYLVVENNGINGGKSIYNLANQCVNRNLLQQKLIMEQTELQVFYDENIYPIRNTVISELTEAQRALTSYYSDWHKDVYGYRPLSKSQDICFQHHNASV